MPLSPQEAAAELWKRRKIRRSLIRWSCHAHPDERPAKHHIFLLKVLQRICRGKLLHPKTGAVVKNLIVLMPPGSAKSTYVSKDFVCWYLANFCHNRIIACSHSADLAADFGRHNRNTIQREAEVLGYSLAGDSQAKDEWGTSNGGEYRAVGVGSGLAGRRADFGLIDDYIGSQEDADSRLIRDKQKSWYDNDFWPRLKPNAIQVIVANRRHEDDLVGRILAEEGDDWLVIRIPMIAESDDPLGRKVGDRLWPEYFTDAMVKKAMRFRRTWGGLYQQRPAPEEGNYFKREWLISYEEGKVPAGLSVYIASDHACTKKETSKDDPDYNLFVPFGLDEGRNVWILPQWWWEQSDTGVAVRKMLDMMRQLRPLAWVAEKDHITKSIGPLLRDMMRMEQTYVTIHELSSRRDKSAKAASIQGKMEFRKVFFPMFHSQWNDVQDQILTFPAGSHDEWPDVLGIIGRFIDRFVAGDEPAEEDGDGRLPTEVVMPTLGQLKASHKRKTMAIESMLRGM